jgi:hypothetical protein
MRTACPGFNVTSRDRPLRLLRIPTIATRSAIGVSAIAARGDGWGADFVAGDAGARAAAEGAGAGAGLASDAGACSF